MAKKFSELRAKMSSEQLMRAEMDEFHKRAAMRFKIVAVGIVLTYCAVWFSIVYLVCNVAGSFIK